MRILFAYRYGALGGVPTQLFSRMQFLKSQKDVAVEFVFGQDFGIKRTLSPYGLVHFEPDEKRFRKWVEHRGYDVVVVIDTEEYLAALRPLAPAPAPVLVAEVHTTTELGLKYLERPFSPSAYVVPSTYSKRLLSERFGIGGGERVFVVPNIVDPELFRPLDVGAVPPRPIVLWVGRLDEHKNWEGYLEVCSLLSMIAPDLEFWMVGGETAPEEIAMCMLETVEGLGLMGRFRWFPKIDYGAMCRAYSYVRASGGVSLVTSKDESFGMSVLESLLSGCPVIASNVGAISEIAPDRPYLRLYDSGATDDACEWVKRLVFEEGRSVRRALSSDMGQLARTYAPSTIGPRYLGVLREIVSGTRATSAGEAH